MGETGKAFAALQELGASFEQLGDLAVSQHFRESALRAARSLEPAEVAAAHGELGLVLEKQGQLAEAIVQLQQVRELAVDTAEACNHLVRLTVALAERCEEAGELEASLENLLSAFELAEEAANTDDAVDCRFRLGRIYVELERPAEAIESLEQYMELAKHDDAVGMNRAFEVVAKCYEQLGDLDRAAGYLERLVETSSRADQHSITSRAAFRLGGIFKAMSDLDKSVHWYTRAFDTVGGPLHCATCVWCPQRLPAPPLRHPVGSVRAASPHPCSSVGSRHAKHAPLHGHDLAQSPQ
jgi:tetratricopeptide (TPR) repeat protein